MRALLHRLALAALLGVTVGVVVTRVSAQTATRLWATLTANLTSGVSTPVTCTASGTGCFLDVSIAGGGGTLTAPLLLPDGSAAAPSLAFTSSTNTGIYFASARFRVAAAGTANALTVNATDVAIQSTLTYNTPLAFAGLGTPQNGTVAFCSDCAPTTAATCPATKASCVCAGGGVGSLAVRANSLWYCSF